MLCYYFIFVHTILYYSMLHYYIIIIIILYFIISPDGFRTVHSWDGLSIYVHPAAVSGCPAVWLSGCPAVRLSSCLAVRLSRPRRPGVHDWAFSLFPSVSFLRLPRCCRPPSGVAFVVFPPPLPSHPEVFASAVSLLLSQASFVSSSPPALEWVKNT